jgi:type IV pilus assembly protein PilM
MSLFGAKPRYVGVDIGGASLKMVEVEYQKHRAQLITYGYVEQMSHILTSTATSAKTEVVNAIKSIRETAHISTTEAVAALPSYTVFTSVIRLPKLSKKELPAAVQAEARKFVPMPIEEMIVDWKVLDEHSTAGHFSANHQAATPGVTTMPATAQIQSADKQYLKILLTAAPKDLVTRYVEIFKLAGLKLVSLETESFALERALVGHDPSPVMLIDMGAVATTISVVVDSVPIINRSIDVGGVSITKAIANSLNVDFDNAEQFKRDFGLMNNQTNSPIPQRIQYMMGSIINEIHYVLNQYQSQNAGMTPMIEKIIVAGGSAWLPNITNYLSAQINLKVFIGDPWSRIQYPPELRPVLQDIGPRMAVAAGLALRELQ